MDTGYVESDTAMGLIDPDKVPRTAFILDERHPPGEGPWHAHRRAQLLHACAGTLMVETDIGKWVVPPQRALWVPPGIRHRVVARRSFHLRTLYVEPGQAGIPDSCRIVAVDHVAEALLADAAKAGCDYPHDGPVARLIGVILDRLPDLGAMPLCLLRPSDPGLRRIADAVAADLAEPRSLVDLAAAAGLHSRTAARRFVCETGMTFGNWRQQLRLLVALESLGEGRSVTAVALDVGYADTSSFIAAFKRAMGTTPARYFGTMSGSSNAGVTSPSRRHKRAACQET